MYIGVDTHKKTHTLVGIDDQGRTDSTRTVANTPQGWTSALRWARDRRDVCCWGIENSGSLGKGFAQFLLAQGETNVRELVHSAPHSIVAAAAARTRPTPPTRWRSHGYCAPRASSCRSCRPTTRAPNCAC